MPYQDLKSYQQSVIIHDYTAEFCGRYVDRSYKSDKSYRWNRQADQMIQAARSGKQNITEGASQRTSRKNEIYLIGVARASLAELGEDYKDFLRQRDLPIWDKDNQRAKEIRGLAYRTNRTYKTYRTYLDDPEAAANCAICLVNQATFLLDRQIKALEKQFIDEGGYTEKLRQKRLDKRKRQIPWPE